MEKQENFFLEQLSKVACLQFLPTMLEVALIGYVKKCFRRLLSLFVNCLFLDTDLCSAIFVYFQVNFWVQREILNTQTEKTRAEVLAHFVKIGKVSRGVLTLFQPVL